MEWKLRTIGNTIFLTNSIKVFEVNSTTAKIFTLCDGVKSISYIVNELKKTFTDFENSDLEADTNEVLLDLKSIGAIQDLL